MSFLFWRASGQLMAARFPTVDVGCNPSNVGLSPRSARMHRILVIDDDRSVGMAIKTMLDHDGYEVLLAHDGRTGIAAIEPGRFDIVIVDIFMPGMDGL